MQIIIRLVFTAAVLCIVLTSVGCKPRGTAGQGTATPPPQANPVATPPADTSDRQKNMPLPDMPKVSQTGNGYSLREMTIGTDYATVSADIPKNWTIMPQWAPGKKNLTGVLNAMAPMSKPDSKGMLTPPEVRNYTFLDGKLVGIILAQPNTPTEGFNKWIADLTGILGAPVDKCPAFAEKCDLLSGTRSVPAGTFVKYWADEAAQNVIATSKTEAMDTVTYYLVNVTEYDKFTKEFIALQSAAANNAPPAETK